MRNLVIGIAGGALFASVSAFAGDDHLGTAADIFVHDGQLAACELVVTITTGTVRDSMVATTAALSKPPFLPRWHSLQKGNLRLQVGSVTYGTTTKFRAVANRKCSASLIRSVRRRIGTLVRGQILARLAIAPSRARVRAMPVTPPPMDDLGTTFRTLQQRYQPAYCTLELVSQSWTEKDTTSMDGPAMRLGGKLEHLQAKYRLPILYTLLANDRYRVLAYDRCDSPEAIAQDLLLSAGLEGVKDIPTDVTVTRTTLSNEDVASLFLFKEACPKGVCNIRPN